MRKGELVVTVSYVGPDDRTWSFQTVGPRPDPRSDDFSKRVGDIVRDAVMAMLRAERESTVKR